MNSQISSFFTIILRSLSHGPGLLKKRVVYWFDFLAVGPLVKKLLIFLGIFAIFFFLWWAIFANWLDNSYSGQINCEISDTPWAIVAQMLDPGNQHMVGNGSGADPKLRLFTLLITVSGTIIFSGLLISAVFSIFENRAKIVHEGLMNYPFNKHFIILGSHSMITGLVMQLSEAKNRIVILTSDSAPQVRHRLQMEVPKKQMKRIVVLSGDRTNEGDLKRLCLPWSKGIYVLGEDHEEDHDSKNNASFLEIEKLLKQHYGGEERNKGGFPKKLECNILFESQTTYAAHQFFNFREANGNPVPLNFNAFSFYEKWAQKVFVACRHNDIHYAPLDYEPISKESDRHVHLIVAGVTRMGIALGIQAARLGHYANYARKKTRVTFIDIDAKREMDFLASRFPQLFKAIDVSYIDLTGNIEDLKKGELPYINLELAFVNARFESPELRQQLINWTADKNALTTIAICFNNPANSLAAGLYLPQQVYLNNTRVLVQQRTGHSILSLMIPDVAKVNNLYRNVKPFGMINDCIDLGLHEDFRAKIINHFYSFNNSLPDKIDDQVIQSMNQEWNDLRERFKWSSRYNAESIPVKLRALGIGDSKSEEIDSLFTPENIEFLARIEHARWNIDALLAGFYPASEDVVTESGRTADLVWNAYLESSKNINDPSYKKLKSMHEEYVKMHKKNMIHPCLVTFDTLSEYYKDIDYRLVKCIPFIEKESEKRATLGQFKKCKA